MKSQIIKKRNSGLSFPDILAFLFIGAILYGCYIYIPMVYKSQELQAIVKDYTFKTGGANAEKLQAAVVEDASYKLGIKLNPEDVTVVIDDERTSIKAIWRPVIVLPLDIRIPRTFEVEYERRQLK